MRQRLAFAATALLLLVASCSSDDTPTISAAETTAANESETDNEPTTSGGETATESPADDAADDAAGEADLIEPAGSCDDIAARFTTRGSANADLADPESSAVCDGDTIVISSNGIPDYTYIETSPGTPAPNDYTFTIPATPAMADTTTDVPALGTAAIALNGVPIYGPTEGTGGDVLSLVGATSECGSHNGPTGFHIHIVLQSPNTDCLFTPEAVAAAPQLVGYAFDGYPIYTGNDQYTSSWQLTDESLFATDTWAAHSYVEGSGDLDQCNGLTDADGNYAYYTTDTFPYVLGCYSGVVDLDAGGAGGGGGLGGDRPERPAEGEG